MTGFLAAIYMRGIRYVQLPTTLLAQVDSSIGGKTGVNLVAGKNLIGSFHHPQAVFADTDLLGTLPPAELRAGLQESIKAGIIYDAKLFRYMEQNAEAILAGDPTALTHVVAASVRVKADVVSKDEKESGLRMILNFGHTIGHAIEAATNYKQLLHGEAVAWGSIAALNVASSRKTITQKDADRITQLILRYGPLPPFKATAEKLVALTSRDKKNRSGIRSFVLPTAIGTTEIVRNVTEPELLSATESSGLAVLYAGYVKQKWAINSAFMCFYAFASVLVVWVLFDYNMAFGEQWFPFLGKPALATSHHGRHSPEARIAYVFSNLETGNVATHENLRFGGARGAARCRVFHQSQRRPGSLGRCRRGCEIYSLECAGAPASSGPARKNQKA